MPWRDQARERCEKALAHDYAECEPSNSGKNQWRCGLCDHIAQSPTYAIYGPCPFRLVRALDLLDRCKRVLASARAVLERFDHTDEACDEVDRIDAILADLRGDA